MLFNSIEFLIFFPVVSLLFFLLPHKSRWLLLLLASCYFYMFFKPEYLLILVFTIVVDYYAGILLETTKDQKQKKYYLLLSIAANVGILAVFKYYNFINTNITGIASLLGYNNPIPYLHMLLPIGLSFHTFQAMSYTIEVYRGNQTAERHFGIYALYVMFYPQLVAGPIERPQNMLHQFHEKKFFDRNRVVSGLKLMLLGFFKKMVIADRLGSFVDPRFNNPFQHTTPPGIAMACVFFAFQIYCDFSAYSDIALGSAQVMGFDLMRNFSSPFTSKNITEFWRRWHISLSTWFNDYLFMPFITAKREWGKWAVVWGLLLTFTISGLWHGAAWTFVVFGVLHGAAMVFEFLTKKTRIKTSKRMPAFIYDNLSRLITFAYLVFAWVFFRAHSFKDARYIIATLCRPDKILSPSGIRTELENMGELTHEFYLSIFLIIAVMIFQNTKLSDFVKNTFNKQPLPVRWLGYYAVFFIILFFGVFGKRQFIYFQF